MISSSDLLNLIFSGRVNPQDVIMLNDDKDELRDYLMDTLGYGEVRDTEVLYGSLSEICWKIVLYEVKNLSECGFMADVLDATPTALLKASTESGPKYFEVWSVYVG